MYTVSDVSVKRLFSYISGITSSLWNTILVIVSRRWVTYAVGLGILAVAVLMWLSLVEQEHAHIMRMTRLGAITVENEMKKHIAETRISLLIRMAKHWQVRERLLQSEWAADAGEFISRHSDLHAIQWVDKSFNVRWAVPAQADKKPVLKIDENRQRAADLSCEKREPVAASILDIGGGKRGFDVYVPILKGNDCIGYIVGSFILQDLLESVFNDFVKLGYRVSIYENDEKIFVHPSEGAYRDNSLSYTTWINMFGMSWKTIVKLSPEMMSESKTILPIVVLLGGIVMSLISAVALRLARKSQIRSKELEDANIRLQAEITERLKTEDKLRESESSLANAQRIAKLGNWDWDIITNELRWSDEIYRIFGIEPHQFKATYEAFLSYVHPDEREFVDKSVKESLYRKRPYSIDHRIVLSDGTERIVHEQAEVTFNAAGQPVRMSGTVQDITEHKKLEEQLRQSQKMEALGTLTGGVAHDFNNILTAIIGYGNIMQMKMKENDPLRAYLDQILASSERAASLNQSLLAFSRKQFISPKYTDLNEIIRNVENLLNRVIGEDIEIAIKPSDEVLTVFADIHQIEQVLMNLSINARDAMPNGGMLTISAHRMKLDHEFAEQHGYGKPGEYAHITVSDTGAGMDKKTVERIFEPFFTTKEMGRGTGLGLAIVYGIVKQHNGYITVDSELGNGTTFNIYLPLFATQEEPTKPHGASGDYNNISGGHETILVVEDDADVRRLINEVLVGNGYKVIEAVDGEDALVKFMESKDSIGIVVLDVVMPKKSGREVYDEILKINPHMKVLFISGYTADQIHKKGIFDDTLNFMPKPIVPPDLLRRLREMLDKK